MPDMTGKAADEMREEPVGKICAWVQLNSRANASLLQDPRA